MPAENWFVATASNGTVEYSLSDLIPAIQSGHISIHNLVWRQGMSDWLEIEQVPLLRMVAVPFEAQPKEPAPIANATPLLSKADEASSYPILDEFEATVIQLRPDLLEDNSWTIEPKATLGKVTNQPPLSIHDLVKRGAVPLAPESRPVSKPLARPVLVRPAVATPDFAIAAPQSNTSESNRLPSHAPPASPQPAHAVAAGLASKASPKPRSSTNPPPSTSHRSAKLPSLPVSASLTLGATANKPNLPAPTTGVTGSERTAARASIQAPSENVAAAHDVPKSVELPNVSHSAPPARLAAASLTQSIAPSPIRVTAPSPTLATASTPAPSATPAHTLSATAAPLPVAVQSAETAPEPVEPIGSIIPAVATIYPDVPEWRKSRRPLVVASGAAAVAIAIFISLGASPKGSQSVRPVAAKLAAAAPSDSPAVAESTNPIVPEIVTEQAPAARLTNPAEQKANPSSTKPSKRTSPIDVTSSADAIRSTRNRARESDTPVASRLPEPKDSPSESSAGAKLTTPGNKKASSVASWDQGTVEHRTWMNPGF